MADMTVTWKGAVPMESFHGTAVGGGGGVLVQHHASYHGPVERVNDDGESVYADAVPYASTDEDFSWAEEFAEATQKVSVETPTVPKRGKRK